MRCVDYFSRDEVSPPTWDPNITWWIIQMHAGGLGLRVYQGDGARDVWLLLREEHVWAVRDRTGKVGQVLMKMLSDYGTPAKVTPLRGWRTIAVEDSMPATVDTKALTPCPLCRKWFGR